MRLVGIMVIAYTLACTLGTMFSILLAFSGVTEWGTIFDWGAHACIGSLVTGVFLSEQEM